MKSKKVCHTRKEKFCHDKNKKKVRGHRHYKRKFSGAAHSECNLRYKVPKEIPVVFRNGSTYDYHFIIKKLTEEFEGKFECLGENTEKYITFSVLLQNQDGNSKKITQKLKFIDSYRLMSTSLSNLVDVDRKFMIKNARSAWKEKKLG